MNQQEILSELLHLWRIDGSFKMLRPFLEAVYSRGLPVSIETIRFFCEHTPYDRWPPLPLFLIDFIVSYLNNKEVRSILDPYAGVNSIIPLLIQSLPESRATGFITSSDDFSILSTFFMDNRLEWRHGSTLSLLQNDGGQYDVVVAFPPITHPSKLTINMPTDHGTISISGGIDFITIVYASSLLAKNGVGFFVVPTSLTVIPKRRKQLLEIFEQLGLSLNAIFSLPSDILKPVASVSMQLLIVSRQSSDLLFIAELTRDQSHYPLLLQRLRDRVAGETPHLGVLVERTTFVSFQQFVILWEIERYRQERDFLAIPFQDLAASFRFLRNDADQFEDIPNAIYLPVSTYGKVIDSPNLITTKHRNYIQIVVNPEYGISSFVSHFLNTPFGRQIRESLSSGGVTQRIGRSSIEQAIFYLPPVDLQAEVSSVNLLLSRYRTYFDRLQQELWDNPSVISEITEKLRPVRIEEDMDQWIETLPFPLASILRKATTEREVKNQIEHYLNFFEAYAAFMCFIILSAFPPNDENTIHTIKTLTTTEMQNKQWLHKPSFGNWKYLLEKIKKSLDLDNLSNYHTIRTVLGSPTPDFMDLLFDPQIPDLLSEPLSYRNQWKGHGGLSGEQELLRRLNLIQRSLDKLRGVVRDRFRHIDLVIPEKSVFRAGIHTYDMRQITGTRTPFREITLRSSYALEADMLYIVHQGSMNPIKFLPFICLHEVSPRTHIVCYFYNGVEDEHIRWVSYHFEVETPPPHTSHDIEVHALLESVVPPRRR